MNLASLFVYLLLNKDRCHYIRPLGHSMSINTTLDGCFEYCYYDSNCNYLQWNNSGFCSKNIALERTDNYLLSTTNQLLSYKKINVPNIRFYGQKCINYPNKQNCNKDSNCSWNKGPYPYNLETWGRNGYCGRVTCNP